MVFDLRVHKRRSTRLQGYDYSQNGAYFITICTHERQCLFGEVIETGRGVLPYAQTYHDGVLPYAQNEFPTESDKICMLNEFGRIAHDELGKTAKLRIDFAVDCFVVMPNHIHAIVVIDRDIGAYGNTRAYSNTPLRVNNGFRSPSDNLGAMVRGYKSTVTKQINLLRSQNGSVPQPVWQRSYHEHIIRNQKAYEMIADYILHNPESWEKDTFYSS